jgi:hypothetical protein
VNGRAGVRATALPAHVQRDAAAKIDELEKLNR